MKHSALTTHQLNEAAAALPDWVIKGGKLNAPFIFKDFVGAMAFLMEIAQHAEKLNHHPEIFNSWNKVEFWLCTHDEGDVITETDVRLADLISKAASELGGSAAPEAG